MIQFQHLKLAVLKRRQALVNGLDGNHSFDGDRRSRIDGGTFDRSRAGEPGSERSSDGSRTPISFTAMAAAFSEAYLFPKDLLRIFKWLTKQRHKPPKVQAVRRNIPSPPPPPPPRVKAHHTTKPIRLPKWHLDSHLQSWYSSLKFRAYPWTRNMAFKYYNYINTELLLEVFPSAGKPFILKDVNTAMVDYSKGYHPPTSPQECARLVQKIFEPNLPTVDHWWEGTLLTTNSASKIAPGTAVAVFRYGRYASRKGYCHTGIFLRYETRGGVEGIVLFDQWQLSKSWESVKDGTAEEKHLSGLPCERFYPFSTGKSKRKNPYKADDFAEILFSPIKK